MKYLKKEASRGFEPLWNCFAGRRITTLPTCLYKSIEPPKPTYGSKSLFFKPSP